MSGSIVSRREFVGLTATAAAGVASLGGCSMIGGAGQGRLVVVTAAPLLAPDRTVDTFRAAAVSLRRAGVDLAVVPVLHEPADSDAMVERLLRLHRYAAQLHDEVRIVSSPGDLDAGAGDGRLRILPQLGGMGFIPGSTPEDMLASVAGLRALGVQIVQPAYYWKNRIGDGCFERTDQRLTLTGRRAIRALNESGILIDLSGMGVRSSMETLDLTARPVIFARSNAAHVHAHRANLTDEQIDGCVRTGSVIGISAFPPLVSGSTTPTLDALLRHIDYIAGRAGIEHVALGIDFDDRERKRFVTDPLPDPPYLYPAGLRRIEELDGLRAALASRGYADTAVRGIFGGNVIRVLSAVWT